MPSLGDFSAQVLVDGLHLTEYSRDPSDKEDSDGMPRKEVFIVAETGKRFTVRVSADTLPSDVDSIAALVHIDGQFVRGTMLYKAESHVLKGALVQGGKKV